MDINAAEGAIVSIIYGGAADPSQRLGLGTLY
jgi:hypothetical protein